MPRPWNKGIKINRKTHPKMGHLTKHSKKTIQKLRVIAKKLNILPPSRKGSKWSDKQRKKMIGLMRGRKITWGNKISRSLIGKHPNEEARRKMSETQKRIAVRGKEHRWWKGGLTEINNKIRSSVEYKLWRESVFKRDNWKCIWCGKGGNLQADHIKPQSKFPKLRFDISNGRTLCVSCHRKTTTYGWGVYNYKK